MQLSPEREAELIEQNMPKIYRAIDNFMARCNNKTSPVKISYDDCVQEVIIVFLEYIRKCETEESLEKFPWYNAINALTRYVLQCQPLSVPSDTKAFSSIIKSMPYTVSYDLLMTNGIDIDGMSKHWVPDTDTKIDFDSFMSEQNEAVQRIASMRLYGMTQRNIASQFGVCKRAIDKKITRLREDFDVFMKEDDEDE